MLARLREEYNADYIIAIMSGNYVQRGEPAVFDKYIRTEAALKGDGDRGYADAVIELPTLYSTASARDFAAYGVKLAVWSGVIDILGFGVEDGVSLEDIFRQAKRKDELESDTSANALMRELLSSGLSYPEAEAVCLSRMNVDVSFSSAPNNILATEYLRALKSFDKEQHIEPVAISRIGDGFNTTSAVDARYCSATALRRLLFESRNNDLICENYIPDSFYLDTAMPVSPDIMSGLLSRALLDAKYRGLILTDYSDVSREIADRLLKTADKPMSFTERVAAVKTRQYTYTRISRALLHIALGISKTDAKFSKINDSDYIRLLGFRRSAAPLLKKLKACSNVPVITKVADHASLMSDEIYYSELLYALTGEKSEYEHSPIVL